MGTPFLTQEECLCRFKEKHGDEYDYSNVSYKTSRDYVLIGCKKHGDFKQLPIEHWKGRGCPVCGVEKLKKWSEDDDKFLIQHYISEGMNFCASALCKTPSSVMTRANKTLKLIRKTPWREPHEHIPNKTWDGILSGAESRGIEVTIDRDYIWSVFKEQDFKCALTGWPIHFGGNKKTSASVDRIDSKIGYHKGNIQILHKMANMCKNVYSQEMFYKLCKDIAEYRAHDLDVLENFEPPA
jgi:hypothetical protein